MLGTFDPASGAVALGNIHGVIWIGGVDGETQVRLNEVPGAV
jgi:hypothetical protein